MSWVWLAGAAGMGLLLRLGSVRLPRLRWRTHLLCWLAALVVSAPRLPYLLEPALGYAVEAVAFDDHWHFQELMSLVNSPAFPPVSTFDPSLLLPYYYGPWIPGAVVWQIGAVVTIKQAFFVLHVLYAAALLYATVYTARAVFRTRLNRSVLFVVVLLFGGFDAFAAPFVKATSEWWAMDLGLMLQFSSTITLLSWVPHHVAGALAVVAAARWADSRRWSDRVTAGVLLASAVGASPLVCLGAVIFLSWWVVTRGLWVSAVVAAGVGSCSARRSGGCTWSPGNVGSPR